MYKPTATYRIQFNKDFNFQSLREIIPYLKQLGIDTIYASPIFEAVSGSVHGYDTLNPHLINPEIGTEEELLQIVNELQHLGIGWIQDIVPNHMAFHPKNTRLADVLKFGIESKFADYFDIDFMHDEKPMVPFLGTSLDEALQNGSLQVSQNNEEYCINYGDDSWPTNLSTRSIIGKKDLSKINQDSKELREIVEHQYYRLCNWQETSTRINYRRFFTVNSLICLNMHRNDVFIDYHKYILKLVEEGVFQGLRIDHVDGLFDPEGYLQQLRKSVGKDVYIVVEKILEKHEQLPAKWPIQGNTGYDFLATCNNLFTHTNTESVFEKLYKQFTGKRQDVALLIHKKKEVILFEHMNGELDNLYQLFRELDLISNQDEDILGAENIRAGLGALMIQMPVYRYYDYQFPLRGQSLNQLQQIIDELAGAKNDGVKALFQKIFIDNPGTNSAKANQHTSKFFQRLMQFTGPLMAKSVEDTMMFTYNRFVGHAEVGDEPQAFGISVADFHSKMASRQALWPLSLNASSTHDTKKGEDVRARLNVLTDTPKVWEGLIEEFSRLTKQIQQSSKSSRQLHKNDLYLIFQTIVGVLPMPGTTDDFENRLLQFIQKALREAKKRSDWAEPDEGYERQLKSYISDLIPKLDNKVFNALHTRITDFGILNSLLQLTLKFTSPGVPDVYQGTELWDLSMVDPDNRRPVDFKRRHELLDSFNDPVFKHLWANRYTGEVKLWLVQRLINIRKFHRQIFEKGDYIPLSVSGKFKRNVMAYARKIQEEWIVCVVPLGLATLLAEADNLHTFDWENTQIIIPEGAPANWVDLVSDKSVSKDILLDGISVDQLLKESPIGLIHFQTNLNPRKAGILMHVSSLPSKFGIGDLGPESRAFVDFLSSANQKLWQILPLNPTLAGNAYSPYSSNAAMAGNTHIISLEMLRDDGLLEDTDLKTNVKKENNGVDFHWVATVKMNILSRAYSNFKKDSKSSLTQEFLKFCVSANNWLADYALYTAISHHNKGLPWHKWPADLRNRNSGALKIFSDKFSKEIEEVKWLQFIFFKQWYQLKAYANERHVQIIGDLPFYIDFNSVEVWCEPKMFKIDKNLAPLKIAGVPPDYFNEEGQLWGMPIYNWDQMKDDGFKWWVERLKNNMDMFDLLRLDHFRAFSSFWEVDAGEKTAINGSWEAGPGKAFFDIVKKNFKNFPFIAEDLGEISRSVEVLRDHYQIPGTKVLQFAFGDDMVGSTHIPYRFVSANGVVYTGTHDNNTVLGWFDEEIDEDIKTRLNSYFGKVITSNNINDMLIRAAYSSIAKWAIIPIQDILCLDASARMNIPGSIKDNWIWQLDKSLLTDEVVAYLQNQTAIYGRL
ncbi:malto-oligosyltrehalose synthase [Pedobacter sandarakinus]|uniref:malto-oligosyltrehalose synthase n=1 Tax=Pedobacter sandarakinus TaxID=353156 RepID=UPI002246637E|nr:malto-oligosyltrehalose synthase [Pedobacter sandarakinus]MCX2575168.1 malto-oligosyltrehalose synthase [Pedobacter sandarakinus]